jgi:hypothetical protein
MSPAVRALCALDLPAVHALQALRLIAVQGSVPYWQKLGFEPVAVELLRAQSADLSTFGANACAMAMPLSA